MVTDSCRHETQKFLEDEPLIVIPNPSFLTLYQHFQFLSSFKVTRFWRLNRVNTYNHPVDLNISPS